MSAARQKLFATRRTCEWRAATRVRDEHNNNVIIITFLSRREYYQLCRRYRESPVPVSLPVVDGLSARADSLQSAYPGAVNWRVTREPRNRKKKKKTTPISPTTRTISVFFLFSTNYYILIRGTVRGCTLDWGRSWVNPPVRGFVRTKNYYNSDSIRLVVRRQHSMF